MSGILDSTVDSIAPSRTLVQWRNTALRFDYHRFGDNHRPLTFRRVGTFAASGADSERYRTVRDGRPLIARFHGSQICDRRLILRCFPYSRSAA